MSTKNKGSTETSEFETGYEHGMAMMRSQALDTRVTKLAADKQSQQVADSLLGTLDDLRQSLIVAYRDAATKGQVARAKLADWSVERIDQGETSIREYQVEYAAALRDGNVDDAERLVLAMNNAKNKVIKDVHVDLLVQRQPSAPIDLTEQSNVTVPLVSYVDGHYGPSAGSNGTSPLAGSEPGIDPFHYRKKYGETRNRDGHSDGVKYAVPPPGAVASPPSTQPVYLVPQSTTAGYIAPQYR